MGSAPSRDDQKELYHQVKEFVDEHSGKLEDAELYDQVNQIYQRWHFKQAINSTLITSPLIKLEYHVDSIYSSGLTPFILDASEDNKVLTFYSYQHTEILDCKKIVTDHLIKKVPLDECLEYCRRLLVNCMKHGKILVINLGATATDFVNIFNDDNLRKHNKTAIPEDKASFPLDLFYGGGERLRNQEWANKLYRESDMAPHKNFAICRDEFRVLLLTTFSPEDCYEYYFGGLPKFLMDHDENFILPMSPIRVPLPDPSNFKLLQILPELEDEKAE